MYLIITKQFENGDTEEGNVRGIICWPAGVSDWPVGAECHSC